LGSKTKFADWIKSRIEKYDFIDGVDFIVQKILNGESRVFQPIEYFISLDMAKELSMVENNVQGKIARLMFLQCDCVD
jgi:anti-repressor protein